MDRWRSHELSGCIDYKGCFTSSLQLLYSAPKAMPPTPPSLFPSVPLTPSPSPSPLPWLCFWPSLSLTPSLYLSPSSSSLFLSSNLCQWNRLKGSVHVWTNPCVSDGLQPQSLLAPPHTKCNPPHPPPRPVCVCVCKHVFMSVAAAWRGQIAALFFHPFAFKLTRLAFHFSPICPLSFLWTDVVLHGGRRLWLGVASADLAWQRGWSA